MLISEITLSLYFSFFKKLFLVISMNLFITESSSKYIFIHHLHLKVNTLFFIILEIYIFYNSKVLTLALLSFYQLKYSMPIT